MFCVQIQTDDHIELNISSSMIRTLSMALHQAKTNRDADREVELQLKLEKQNENTNITSPKLSVPDSDTHNLSSKMPDIDDAQSKYLMPSSLKSSKDNQRRSLAFHTLPLTKSSLISLSSSPSSFITSTDLSLSEQYCYTEPHSGAKVRASHLFRNRTGIAVAYRVEGSEEVSSLYLLILIFN
jgi:hypothetical protein